MQYFNNNQFSKYSILLNSKSIQLQSNNIQYLNTFSITSITFIYLSIYEFFETINFRFIYSSKFFTISNFYALFIYYSVKMTTFAIIFAFDFLSFSFVFCDYVFDDHSMTQNLKTLYNMHLIENVKILRCNWFIQAKKTQKNYHLRKHELKIKNKLKKKNETIDKTKKKVRLIKKRIEKYTCKRCKNKFDNNIKFHEYIRIRHAKKSKFVQQFVVSSVFESKFFIFFVSSFRSIISSFFTLSKFLFFSMFVSEIVRERSKNTFFFEISSRFSSIETSKKSIFWTKITSRSIVVSKFFRFSIATFKSMCKSLKNANIVCSFISFRTFTSSKLYFIVNNLFHIFVEKSNSFDLQRHRMRSFFSKIYNKCNFKNNYDFIQNRITLYFHATISSVFKSIKFETFASIHVSIKYSIRISFSRIFRFFFFSIRFFFSTFSRSFFVCKHCQKRFVIYWFIDWIMSNVSKIENNEIFMKMRYWRFVFFFILFWKSIDFFTFWNHYFEKINMLFFVLFVHFILLIVDRSNLKKHKNCCCCF